MRKPAFDAVTAASPPAGPAPTITTSNERSNAFIRGCASLDGERPGRTGDDAGIAEDAFALNDLKHSRTQDERIVAADGHAQSTLGAGLLIENELFDRHGTQESEADLFLR